jgi:hypothetical protein
MTTTQQIFVIFFAIFWGTTANAWPHWKPFHWTFLFYSWRVCGRVLWSMLVLNVAPVFVFGWALMKLGRDGAQTVLGWNEILSGIVPAFAVFGIYRIWIAGIELYPSAFYYDDDAEQEKDHPELKGSDPTIKGLKLSGKRWFINLLFGSVYVIVAVMFVTQRWPFACP